MQLAARRRRIIFIPDRLRQNKKEVHLPFFFFFSARRVSVRAIFLSSDDIKEALACLFFLFQACRSLSQYAPRERESEISQPFLDYM
jgi:hypothetical protein